MTDPASNDRKKLVEANTRALSTSVGAQLPADIASRAVSEHKSEGVDDGHQCEYHAGGTTDAGSKLADEKGVSHVVDAGHQHADGGGKPQP